MQFCFNIQIKNWIKSELANVTQFDPDYVRDTTSATRTDLTLVSKSGNSSQMITPHFALLSARDKTEGDFIFPFHLFVTFLLHFSVFAVFFFVFISFTVLWVTHGRVLLPTGYYYDLLQNAKFTPKLNLLLSS